MGILVIINRKHASLLALQHKMDSIALLILLLKLVFLFVLSNQTFLEMQQFLVISVVLVVVVAVNLETTQLRDVFQYVHQHLHTGQIL